VASDFKWPLLQADKKYYSRIQTYFMSFKNIYSENINSSNLMFFTGPTKCGKSYLLQQCIENFTKASMVKPSLFYFDFQAESPLLTFEMFLPKFEAMLVDRICEFSNTLWFKSQPDQFFAMVAKVLERFYDMHLLEH